MEGLLPGWEAVPSGEEFYYWNRSSACALPFNIVARRGAALVHSSLPCSCSPTPNLCVV